MNTKSNNTDFIAMNDISIVKDICSGLKQMRLNKNISQTQLAESTGVARITISRMENGQTSITLLTFVQLLRGLGELDRLNAFKSTVEVSPLKMLKTMENARQRSSHQRNRITHKPTSKW